MLKQLPYKEIWAVDFKFNRGVALVVFTSKLLSWHQNLVDGDLQRWFYFRSTASTGANNLGMNVAMDLKNIAHWLY